MTNSSNLFKSIQVGKLALDHRVVMAPLTRMRAIGHQVKDMHADYYGQRSSAPGTLLITEATFISEAASGYPNAPGIYKQEHIDGWRKVFSAIHDKKSYVYVQLWALGRMATKADLDARGLPYVSASNFKVNANDPNSPAPRGLTKDEIKEYIATYVQAAKNAIEAGADGVEIHSANGYLLNQFLHEGTNDRTDEYGGSIENRARFTLEVVDAISAAIGADRTAIRLSPWTEFGAPHPGLSPIPQFAYLVAELEKRALAGQKLAYLHLVQRRLPTPDPRDYAFTDGDNAFIRQIWTGPIITAGGYKFDSALKQTDTDDNLLIGMGRYFISTPDLVARWKKGIPENPYDRKTFYADGLVGYTDYPFAEELSATA